MNVQFAALIPVVYALIEGLEWLGLRKSIAHLIALPIGILLSFLVIPGKSVVENIIFGLVIGIGAAGTCDTVGNCGRLAGRRQEPAGTGKRRTKRK